MFIPAWLEVKEMNTLFASFLWFICTINIVSQILVTQTKADEFLYPNEFDSFYFVMLAKDFFVFYMLLKYFGN